MQTKKQSFVEVVISTFIGMLVSLLAQLTIYPLYEMELKLSQNIQITIIFTVVSILRSYFVRRFFNKKHKTSHLQ